MIRERIRKRETAKNFSFADFAFLPKNLIIRPEKLAGKIRWNGKNKKNLAPAFFLLFEASECDEFTWKQIFEFFIFIFSGEPTRPTGKKFTPDREPVGSFIDSETRKLRRSESPKKETPHKPYRGEDPYPGSRTYEGK